MSIEKDSTSKFNMSMLILRRIDKMQTMAAGYYRNGYLLDWFFEWKNIKFQIIGKIESDTREELRKLEEDIIKHKIKKEEEGYSLSGEGISLVEEYIALLQDIIEEKDIGLVGKGDETTFT